MSVRLSDEFAALEKRDQDGILLFESSVSSCSDNQLRRELAYIRRAFQIVRDLERNEVDPLESNRLSYFSKRIDLELTIVQNELTRKRVQVVH